MDMKLRDSQPKKGPAGAMAGCLIGMISLVLLWVGFHSVLIGWAYHMRKGFWFPCLVGSLLLFFGILLLLKGVSRIAGHRDRPPDNNQH